VYKLQYGARALLGAQAPLATGLIQTFVRIRLELLASVCVGVLKVLLGGGGLEYVSYIMA